MITAVVVAVSLLLLTPLFYYLPKAVLASIIMTAVFGLIDVAEARHLWATSRADFALMGLTFGATLALGIEQGIGLGVAASLLWFVLSSSRPNVVVLGMLPGTDVFRDVTRREDAQVRGDVVVVRVDAPLFFANSSMLQEAVRGLVSEETRAVILDASAMGSIDASGSSALAELAATLDASGVEFWLSTVRGPVRDMLGHGVLGVHVPPERVVERVVDAWSSIAPPLHDEPIREGLSALASAS